MTPECAHIGVDAKSGLVHTIKTTTAKVHDARMTDDLIRTDDAVVFGDKGYVSDKRKRASRADGVLWAVKDSANLGGSCRPHKRNGTENMARCGPRSSISSASSNASLVIARRAIGAWPCVR